MRSDKYSDYRGDKTKRAENRGTNTGHKWHCDDRATVELRLLPFMYIPLVVSQPAQLLL
jgi:hypothetical protein